MKYNIVDRRRRSVYSTNKSTLPLIIQLQSKPRSRSKLFKIVNPTFSVYIIVLCPENASNDTVTGLNWIPGTDKMDTHQTPARFPFFEWVLYREHTFTDKRQNTRNRRPNRFLPLSIRPFSVEKLENQCFSWAYFNFSQQKENIWLTTTCDPQNVHPCRSRLISSGALNPRAPGRGPSKKPHVLEHLRVGF